MVPGPSPLPRLSVTLQPYPLRFLTRSSNKILSPRSEVGVTKAKAISPGNMSKKGKGRGAQGVPKVVISESVSVRAAEQRSDRASSTHPRPLVPCHQCNRGVEADHRSILHQHLRALPELHYGDASINPRGPTEGPVVNIPRPERCLLSYRGQPSRHMLPTLLSQRHRLAVHSTAIRVVNQSESILPKYSNQY